MTIKVASDGFHGAFYGYGGVMLIDGVLHQEIRTVAGPSVWVPVPTYSGFVEHVDTQGKTIIPARRQTSGAPDA